MTGNPFEAPATVALPRAALPAVGRLAAEAAESLVRQPGWLAVYAGLFTATQVLVHAATVAGGPGVGPVVELAAGLPVYAFTIPLLGVLEAGEPRPSGPSDAVARALRAWPATLLVVTVVTMAMMAGLACCLVPALVILVWTVATELLPALEPGAPLGQRSVELVRGQAWPLTGRVGVLTFAPFVGVALADTVAEAALGDATLGARLVSWALYLPLGAWTAAVQLRLYQALIVDRPPRGTGGSAGGWPLSA